MRIGVMCGAPGASCGPESSLADFTSFAKRAESLGFASLWMAQIFGHDAISTLALIGRETERIELGTAVVPIYTKHPVAMAQESLTAAAASAGRFTLGIGLSHKVVVETNFGLSFERPALRMTEYLEALNRLLVGKTTKSKGTFYSLAARLTVPDAPAVPVLVAALGDRMLRLTGQLAGGTITWMCGPETLEQHIIPKIRAGAAEAERPVPRIVAGFPVALVGGGAVDDARAHIAKHFEVYGSLPSYRAMLDHGGAAGPADVALVGDESELRKRLATLRDVGVTDFDAFVVPVDPHAEERTLEFLASEQ